MNPAKSLLTPKRIVTAALILLVVAAGLTYAAFRQNTAEAGDKNSSATVARPAAAASGLAAADKNGDGIVYQSGMHPWIVMDAPGQCPICGMDLVATPVGQVEQGVVKIDPVTIQNIGVRTAPVVMESLDRSVRTTGRFEATEQGLTAVSPKVGGWVEKLYVNYEGARVKKGQPLLTIYSPDLVSTQEEYLLSLRNAERLKGSVDAQRLVEAARRRLEYWDISAAQIKRLEETHQPQKTLTLYAPASGTVTKKEVVEGQQIAPGMTLMELSNLSRLWLMVDVYEQDQSWVKVGTQASIEFPYEPGRTLTGRVDYIYDDLDMETRTLKARVTLPNPGLEFKPGMFATVTLSGGGTASYPVVPEEALIRTGEEAVVILALGEGRFMPAKVVPGLVSNGRAQILSGLQGGEEVVTSAQFLIDSEARLQSAVGAMMSGHNHGATTANAAPVPAPSSTAPAASAAKPAAVPAQTAPAAKATGKQVVRITVGPKGFAPEKIELKAGVPVQLVFKRTTDATCATDVQSPALGIKKTALPLNKEVTITVTPGAAGTFTYACGMNMITGSVLVKS